MNRHIPSSLLLLLALLVITNLACGPTPSATVDPTGGSGAELDPANAAAPETRTLSGHVIIPGLAEVPLQLTITEGDGVEPTAELKMSSPDQAAVLVESLTITEERIRFELIRTGGGASVTATFDLERKDGDRFEGTLEQDGGHYTVKMAPGVMKLARPQTPQPPFPYDVEEVSYENPSAGITIAGTLTLPSGEGPHPVALMITGSGPQDRDETIFGHKPFFVIADHLTRHGVAVLRVDDRGVGGTGGELTSSTINDFKGDVIAGLDFLEGHPRIDAAKIGLIGHSEGGIIAPMVAAERDDVAFVVLMAGTGLPGAWILETQNRLLLEASGVPTERARGMSERVARVVELRHLDASDETLREAALALAREQIAVGEEYFDGAAATEEELIEGVDQLIERFQSPWLDSFLDTNPREHLLKVKVPVLAINGSLDLQVPPQANLDAIAAALAEGGNEDVTIELLPSLNHLFQRAELGTVVEYGKLEETLAPEVLELMQTWIARVVMSPER